MLMHMAELQGWSSALQGDLSSVWPRAGPSTSLLSIGSPLTASKQARNVCHFQNTLFKAAERGDAMGACALPARAAGRLTQSVNMARKNNSPMWQHAGSGLHYSKDAGSVWTLDHDNGLLWRELSAVSSTPTVAIAVLIRVEMYRCNQRMRGDSSPTSHPLPPYVCGTSCLCTRFVLNSKPHVSKICNPPVSGPVCHVLW